MLAPERPQRHPQHVAAGRAAHAAVEPHGGFLLHRAAARIDITAVEPAAQERFKMRGFQLLEQSPLAGDYIGDVRQLGRCRQNLLDHIVEIRRNDRPSLPHDLPGPLIEAEMLDAGLKSLAKSGFLHDDATWLAEPACWGTNGLFTLNGTGPHRPCPRGAAVRAERLVGASQNTHSAACGSGKADPCNAGPKCTFAHCALRWG